MTEGQGVTAASMPRGGAEAGAAHVQAPGPDPGGNPPGQGAGGAPAGPAAGRSSPKQNAVHEAAHDVEPHIRVDARKLESALLALRHQIVELPLEFESPGVGEARAERRKLLSQIDDYLLPRLRQSGAPIMVALVGSTGAGKSTLMNSQRSEASRN